MVSKAILVVCFICLISISCIDAQRDGRRRSGRRKPTTEIPPPPEADAEEENAGKSDGGEPEELPTVKASQAPSEPETSAPPSNKDAKNQAGTQFLVPRGTRKPRRMPTRGEGEASPRPTLPTFARRGSSRSRQKVEDDSQKNRIDSVVTPSTSTTARPGRGSSSSSSSSRRRNNNSNNNSNNNATPVASSDSENGDGNQQKKRFGGGSTRRPSRTSRRTTAALPL